MSLHGTTQQPLPRSRPVFPNHEAMEPSRCGYRHHNEAARPSGGILHKRFQPYFHACAYRCKIKWKIFDLRHIPPAQCAKKGRDYFLVPHVLSVLFTRSCDQVAGPLRLRPTFMRPWGKKYKRARLLEQECGRQASGHLLVDAVRHQFFSELAVPKGTGCFAVVISCIMHRCCCPYVCWGLFHRANGGGSAAPQMSCLFPLHDRKKEKSISVSYFA